MFWENYQDKSKRIQLMPVLLISNIFLEITYTLKKKRNILYTKLALGFTVGFILDLGICRKNSLLMKDGELEVASRGFEML